MNSYLRTIMELYEYIKVYKRKGWWVCVSVMDLVADLVASVASDLIDAAVAVDVVEDVEGVEEEVANML